MRSGGMPAARARRGALGEERRHVGHDVVVVRIGVGHSWRQADVGDDDRRIVLGRRRGVVGVAEAADVVAHHRALGVTGPGDRGPPGVDGDRRVEAGDQAGDDRGDALELLGLGHLGAGPRFDATDIEDVGAVGDQLLGPRVELVELEGGALVIEGVGRAVEDPHHEGPVSEVVAAAAEVERGRAREVGGARRRRGAGCGPASVAAAPRAIRTAAPPARAGTRWCAGRWRPSPRGGRRTPGARRRRRARVRGAR